MKTITFAAVATMMAAPVFAEGDAAAGEEQFNRQCVACHVVKDPDGNTLAGRTARTGPNLYGLAGRAVAHQDGFRYSDAVSALGETGAVWNEDDFVTYVQNPTQFLRDKLDDRRARSKMAYQVRSTEQAADIYAFLATFGGS